MKRGALTKDQKKLIPIWIPKTLLPPLDQGVKMEDSDRSKFIRKAIREKLNSVGIITDI